MKITFVGHASILVETNGVTILSDPWWNGPCFGAQWWIHPQPYLAALDHRAPDYIYISHGHHDHFHPPTLKLFDRSATILIAKDSDLYGPIRALGFHVIQINDDEERPLSGNVHCRIIKTYADDSLMTITDGTETCVNINDALHSYPVTLQNHFTRLLRTYHPRIDYVFCGYGVASHFPNCYLVPGKNNTPTAIQRQRYFNRAWSHIVHSLTPRFAFPFAADVVFLEQDLLWTNEPVHNGERPTDAFTRLNPTSPTTVVDIASGFSIENGMIVSNARRQRLSGQRLTELYEDSIRRVNRHAPVDTDSLRRVVALLKRNIEHCRPYLTSFSGNYRCLIRFKGSDHAIQVAKTGSRIDVTETAVSSHPKEHYHLVYTTRLAYLKNSLTTAYGHEVLFVGSGGIFEYTSASMIRDNIHRELAVMMRRMDTCPAPRLRGFMQGVYALKRFVKRLVGRQQDDLYDLKKWTVFSADDHLEERSAPLSRNHRDDPEDFSSRIGETFSS